MECTRTLKSVLGLAGVIAVPSLEGTFVLKIDTVNSLIFAVAPAGRFLYRGKFPMEV
jgi:hypothetical protein